jgi:UDP-N-acetylglucosamine acyltransferase
MAMIHPTAVIDPKAELGSDVEIGPYCIIGGDVRIGVGTKLRASIHVDGWTQIGAHCDVFPFASLGAQSQDLKYRGGRPGVVIGDRTTLREYVTVNAATADGDLTRVGSDCHIMAYAHVAHDCTVGNRVILANAATLAGHVQIDDGAIIGGLCGIHQFVRVGSLSMTGGCSKIVKDLPPYMIADGNPLSVHGINKVGLERAGIAADSIAALRSAFRILYRSSSTAVAAVADLRSSFPGIPEVETLARFVETSERGITR